MLHYVGESVNVIFETLPDTDAGEDENPLEKAELPPKKNREYEVYVGFVLLMENLAVGVENKTTLKLYADPKILTREISSTVKTWSMNTPVRTNRMILLIRFLSIALTKRNRSPCSK